MFPKVSSAYVTSLNALCCLFLRHVFDMERVNALSQFVSIKRFLGELYNFIDIYRTEFIKVRDNFWKKFSTKNYAIYFDFAKAVADFKKNCILKFVNDKQVC